MILLNFVVFDDFPKDAAFIHDIIKPGESNGKLPPRTCPGCSVPEPYRSHDWALFPANPASKAEY